MNPYEVLGVAREAGPQDIVRAVALALRERRHSARDVAEARQQLMDPSVRPLLDFVHFADLELLLKSPLRPDAPLRADELKRLEIFDAQT